MTIEERAELAVETFAAGKGNCTQSVLCAWEDKIPVDHEMLMKLGAGYGAGMGCMQGLKGRGDRQGPLSLRAVRSQRRPRRRRDAGGVKGEKPSSLRALSKK